MFNCLIYEHLSISKSSLDPFPPGDIYKLAAKLSLHYIPENTLLYPAMLQKSY